MPALTPVATKPIASLNRDRGVAASITENSAIRVGRERQAGDEQAGGDGDQPRQQRQHRGADGEQHQPDPRPLHRAAAEGHRAGHHAGETAAEGEHPEHQPGDGPVAGVARPARPWPPPARRRGCRARRRRASAAPARPRASGPGPWSGRGGGRAVRCVAAAPGRRSRRCRAPARPAARTAARAAVERKVTSAGPVTKTTSSTTPSTAKAVCRSASSSSRWAHRLRTRLPAGGMAAPDRARQQRGGRAAASPR